MMTKFLTHTSIYDRNNASKFRGRARKIMGALEILDAGMPYRGKSLELFMVSPAGFPPSIITPRLSSHLRPLHYQLLQHQHTYRLHDMPISVFHFWVNVKRTCLSHGICQRQPFQPFPIWIWCHAAKACFWLATHRLHFSHEWHHLSSGSFLRKKTGTVGWSNRTILVLSINTVDICWYDINNMFAIFSNILYSLAIWDVTLESILVSASSSAIHWTFNLKNRAERKESVCGFVHLAI